MSTFIELFPSRRVSIVFLPAAQIPTKPPCRACLQNILGLEPFFRIPTATPQGRATVISHPDYGQKPPN